MSCPLCDGKGVVRVKYESGEPDDFGVCVCGIGRQMLETRNAGRDTSFALWQVWAAKEQIDPETIFDLTDLLPPELLRQHSSVPRPEGSRESALLNASRKRPKL